MPKFAANLTMLYQEYPLLERIERAFGVAVDRESLVSSLTKKVARGDRFVRTGRNTFALKEGAS